MSKYWQHQLGLDVNECALCFTMATSENLLKMAKTHIIYLHTAVNILLDESEYDVDLRAECVCVCMCRWLSNI